MWSRHICVGTSWWVLAVERALIRLGPQVANCPMAGVRAVSVCALHPTAEAVPEFSPDSPPASPDTAPSASLAVPGLQGHSGRSLLLFALGLLVFCRDPAVSGPTGPGEQGWPCGEAAASRCTGQSGPLSAPGRPDQGTPRSPRLAPLCRCPGAWARSSGCGRARSTALRAATAVSWTISNLLILF